MTDGSPPPAELGITEKDLGLHNSVNLAEVARQYNVVFIHGIHAGFTPPNNSLLKESADWKTKLNILLAFGPTLSTSTLRAGDNYNNMWSRMGVILGGGEIVAAHVADAGTVATGIKSRIHGAEGDLNQAIKQAITSTERGRAVEGAGHNELVMENPQIAGFYVCVDDVGGMESTDLVPLPQIIKTIQGLELPIYAIKQGEVYESSYDASLKKLIPGRKIPPAEISQRNIQLPEKLKQTLEDKLLKEQPFRMFRLEQDVPEIGYIQAWGLGRETYIETNASINPNQFQGKEFTYKDKDPWIIENGTPVRLIGRFGTYTSYSEYFIYEGKLYRRLLIYEYNSQDTQMIEHPPGVKDGLIHLSYGFYKIGESIDGNENYLAQMEKNIDDLIANPNSSETQTQIEKLLLKELAFHLYGYGEQAKQNGDLATYERANQAARKVVPYEQYQEIVSRRIDKRGRPKFTQQDLLLVA